MSLDIYLESVVCEHCGRGGEEVFSVNITHNLTGMADEAGIYKHLWRPEELRIAKAEELIAPLSAAVKLMMDDPGRFRKHNPENGWGDYGVFLSAVESYLSACKRYPKATLRVWR